LNADVEGSEAWKRGVEDGECEEGSECGDEGDGEGLEEEAAGWGHAGCNRL
jgi:hypothetical protein